MIVATQISTNSPRHLAILSRSHWKRLLRPAHVAFGNLSPSRSPRLRSPWGGKEGGRPRRELSICGESITETCFARGSFPWDEYVGETRGIRGEIYALADKDLAKEGGKAAKKKGSCAVR